MSARKLVKVLYREMAMKKENKLYIGEEALTTLVDKVDFRKYRKVMITFEPGGLEKWCLCKKKERKKEKGGMREDSFA